MVRIKPGAFSKNHGDEQVLSSVAQEKDSRMPAMTALMKILSLRMLALYTPALPTNSVVSFGEYALNPTIVADVVEGDVITEDQISEEV